MDALDKTAIMLPCFEPMNESIDFTWRDLLGHTVILGSTGSGKTTRLIEPMIHQLIQQRTYTGHYAPLLILDGKNDAAMEGRIRHSLACMGRDAGMRVISPERGNCSLDMFDMDGNATDELSEIITSAVPKDHSNAYWEEFMKSFCSYLIDTIELLTPEAGFEEKVALVRSIIMETREVHGYIDELNDLRKESDSTEQHRRIKECTEALKMWSALDPRTKSNHRSTALCMVKPLRSRLLRTLSLIRRYRFSWKEFFKDKQVVIVRINAFEDMEAAKFLFSVIKSGYYSALMSHPQKPPSKTALSAIIMDEWGLSVTGGQSRYSDRVAMQSIRSRGGAVIAATQGVRALEQVVGERETDAILANANNVLLMRSRDASTEQFAQRLFGVEYKDLTERRETTWRGRRESDAWTAAHCLIERETLLPRLKLGTLASLQTGECVGIVGSELFTKPRWIAWHPDPN